MIQSMTGFGQADITLKGLRVNVDLKSLNHRYSEVVVRLPKEWIPLEYEIRKKVQAKFKRGRIDVLVSLEWEEQSSKLASINWPVAESYLACAKLLQDQWGLKAAERDALDWFSLPDFITFTDSSTLQGEEVASAILSTVDRAADNLLNMRRREGQHLAQELRKQIEQLEQYQQGMQQLASEVTEKYRHRLEKRIKDMLNDSVELDESRLQMEVALMAERSAIDEELDRLQSHVRQCRQLLQTEEPIGRKFDFIVQEMNREINTIGSKAGHEEIIHLVVESKAILEKLREQIQNIQ